MAPKTPWYLDSDLRIETRGSSRKWVCYRFEVLKLRWFPFRSRKTVLLHKVWFSRRLQKQKSDALFPWRSRTSHIPLSASVTLWKMQCSSRMLFPLNTMSWGMLELPDPTLRWSRMTGKKLFSCHIQKKNIKRFKLVSFIRPQRKRCDRLVLSISTAR